MANVIGSFSQGYGVGRQMVNDYHADQDREHNNTRRETLEQRQDADYKNKIERDKITNAQADTLFAQGQKEYEDKIERLKTLREREDLLFAQGQTDRENQLKEQQYQTDNLRIQNYYQSYLSTGRLAPMDAETRQAFDNHPSLREAIFNANSPENVQAYMDVQNVFKGVAQGELPDVDDPKLLNAANYLFSDLVSASNLPQQYGGKQIKSREISRVIPTKEGGYALEQTITFKDGSTRKAPVTRNRSDAEDDEVAVISPKVITERLKNLSVVLQAGQGNQEQASKFYTMHWLNNGKSGSKSGSTYGGFGSSSNSDYTKAYMNDIRTVSNKYAEQIQKIQINDQIPEPQKQALINQMQKDKESQLDEVRRQWSQFTAVGDLGAERQHRVNAATNLVNRVVSQMPDYQFPADVQEQMINNVLNGEIQDPQMLEGFVEFLIDKGTITPRQSQTPDSDADSNVSYWKNKTRTPPSPQPQGNESGFSLSDAMRFSKY